jgi:tyrosinase
LTLDRYALGGNAFTIRVFIGNVPEGHNATVSQALTQVGEIYNFSDPIELDKPGCANCKKNHENKLKTTGQVPLTNALLTRYKQQIPHETESGEITLLGGMEPEQVVPFLKKNFHWRITDVSPADTSVEPFHSCGFSIPPLYPSHTCPFSSIHGAVANPTPTARGLRD